MTKEKIIIERHMLLNALALDSIYNVLSWYERAMLHMMIHERVDLETISTRTATLVYTMVLNKWKAPQTKYPEFQKDVLHYLTPDEDWMPVDHYREINKELTQQIIKSYE